MSEPVLSATDEPFLDLAVAIADGTPIDWGAAGVADSSEDAGAVVLRLQYLEKLVRGHETVRSQSSHASTPAHDTVLTEARKRAAGGGEPLLDVRWGPLVVLEKIGRGSFGDVYRAWDPRLDREVALKLVPERTPESVSSPVVAEGRLLARVRHPNVLTVHGAERIDGRAGIWTEYVRGETLAQEIAKRGPVPSDEAARIGIEVCRALEAVHGAGLLHRDVKAQNILRDSTGRIVLGDFGTGVEFDDQAAAAEPQIAGTPLYLAPEILDGRPASTASDLYSVGVLLYFLVTGNYSVRGRTMADVRKAHARGERVPLAMSGRELPQPFVDVVETLLGSDPSSRFPTAGAVAAGLAESIGTNNEPPVEALTRRRPRIGRRVAAVVAAGVLIAAAALTIVTLHPGTALAPAHTVTGGSAARVTAGDWILVASFDNRSGEANLDGTIDAALKRELEYSEHVRVAQRDRWEDALRLLRQPLDTRLEPALARDVSLRDGGIRTLLTGRVEKTASRYTITVTIVSPATGTTLAILTEDAPGRAQLLPAVRRLALRLRDLFGETPDALDRARTELERVPMPSLGALSFHSRALTQANVRGSLTPVQQHERWAGVERLERAALAEDPALAHAWIMLAWALRNQNQPRDAYLPYARRALALADTTTPQERLFILGSFHDLQAFTELNSRTTDNPQELEQAIAAYEALFTLQPDHYYVLNNLRRDYVVLGRDHDLALMLIRLADARPANVRLNIDAAATLVDAGNLAAARRYAARAETAISHDPAGDNLGDRSYTELFQACLDWYEERPRESFERASRLAATVDRIPDDPRGVPFRVRLVLLYLALGQLREAQLLAERGRVWEGSSPQLLAYVLRERRDLDGLRDYLTTRWTREQMSKAATTVGWRLEFLVPAGMLDEAERDIARYKRQLPEGVVATSFYPFLMGELEMGRGRPREAARLLEPWLASPSRVPVLANHQVPAQKLADAWEALGHTTKAIELLEKVVEHRPAVLDSVTRHMWLTTNAQLARLYRKNGQVPEARAIEQRLLRMLAVADADHPLVLELKSRP